MEKDVRGREEELETGRRKRERERERYKVQGKSVTQKVLQPIPRSYR